MRSFIAAVGGVCALASAACGLSGCAEYNAAVSAGTNFASTQVTAQKENIQALNDVAAKALAASLCAVPYGELVRNGSGNPNFPTAVIEACGGPSGYTLVHNASTATATTTIPTTVVPTSAAGQTGAAAGAATTSQ
jgi:hypothetical protein